MQKTVLGGMFACAALLAAAVPARVAAQGMAGAPEMGSRAPVQRETPRSIIRSWPKMARMAARSMMEEYGMPDQFDHRSLAWFNKGPWKRTIVYRKALRHRRAGDRDYLQQTVGYIVPEDKIAEVKRLHPLIEVSQIAGEMSFCSDNEKNNFVIINLAQEIATGKKSVEQADVAYQRINRLEAAGKSSPYARGLMFPVDNTMHMIPGGD